MQDDMPSFADLLARSANEPMDVILKDAERCYEQSMRTAAMIMSGKAQLPDGVTRDEALLPFKQNIIALRGLMDRYGWKYNAYGT